MPMLTGAYRIGAIAFEHRSVFTNKMTTDAYRGAGKPEACHAIECLMDEIAASLEIDPAEIRRRNFIKSFPYQTPVALMYDTGDYEATLGAVIKMADVAGYAKRKEESAKRGKLRGLGYACYIEACGIAPSNIAGALGAREHARREFVVRAPVQLKPACGRAHCFSHLLHA